MKKQNERKIKRISAEEMIRLNKPIPDISKELGISTATLYRWKKLLQISDEKSIISTDIIKCDIPPISKQSDIPTIEDTIQLFHMKLHRAINSGLNLANAGSISTALKTLRDMGNLNSAKNELQQLIGMISDEDNAISNETDMDDEPIDVIDIEDEISIDISNENLMDILNGMSDEE
jgi:hypothetical protein